VDGLPPRSHIAVVLDDVGRADEPTLIVKPAEAGGYAALLWRQGYRALMQAEQYGRCGAPLVWAHGPGRREIAGGVPGEGGALRFTFPRGESTYKQLVSTPGLRAIVVVDRATSRIMGVRFHHRRRP
jgi:hypothetical protein